MDKSSFESLKSLVRSVVQEELRALSIPKELIGIVTEVLDNGYVKVSFPVGNASDQYKIKNMSGATLSEDDGVVVYSTGTNMANAIIIKKFGG